MSTKKAVAIFMAICWLLSCKDIRLSIHNELLHLCFNLDLAVRGAIAFLILFSLIFCNMPSPTKNASRVNNSNLTNTSTGTKSVEISQLFHPELIEFTRQLSAMRYWLNAYHEAFANDYDQVHRHLLNAECYLNDVASEFSAMIAIEFKEKVYFNNL